MVKNNKEVGSSNKSENTLLVVAVIAVVVSALALFSAYTGIYNLQNTLLAPGNASVNVTEQVSIVLVTDKINWGNGFFPNSPPENSVKLESYDGNGPAFGSGYYSYPSPYWNRTTANGDKSDDGFIVNNTGNVPVNITVSTNSNATAFLYAGVDPTAYAFSNLANLTYQTDDLAIDTDAAGLLTGDVPNNEDCAQFATGPNNGWVELRNPGTAYPFCHNLPASVGANARDGQTEIEIGITVPKDVPAGLKSVQININAAKL